MHLKTIKLVSWVSLLCFLQDPKISSIPLSFAESFFLLNTDRSLYWFYISVHLKWVLDNQQLERKQHWSLGTDQKVIFLQDRGEAELSNQHQL